VTRLAVDLDQARIALSAPSGRTCKTLATPTDVVLVDGSEPLNKAQAAKLKKLEEQLRDEPAPGAAPQERERKARTVITVDAPAASGSPATTPSSSSVSSRDFGS
jgi:hypothetical protein